MEKLSYQDVIRETGSNFMVHTRIYRDPQIFEDEMRRIFERSWVYVAHESEVLRIGDYLTTVIGRQPVIVSRSEDGRINVLLNICRHRGNAVCREERGNSNFFRCPYHGWLYSNNGKLMGISQRSGYGEDFGKDIEGLIQVPRVAIYRGLVFASLSADGESLDEYLGEAKKYVDLWADLSPEGEVRVLRPHKFIYPGNWKFQVENGVDGYHPGVVHESAFKTMEHFGAPPVGDSATERDIGCTRGFKNGHCLLERPGLFNEVGVGGVIEEIGPKLRSSLLRRHSEQRVEEILNTRYIQIFPNVCLMEASIRVIRPVSVDRTVVDSYFTEWQGVSDEVNRIRFLNMQARLGTAGFIAPDDMELFATNQTGMQASGMEWIMLSRGMHREVIHPNGERVGHASDETYQRAISRGWARLMNGSIA